jgi:hypothetical protein
MSRPRKPTDRLLRKPRKNENRGYNSTNTTNEIQREILFQFNRIKQSLSKVDPVSNVKTYKILIDELLKINNQMKTFSISDNGVNELKEILNNLDIE